MIQHFLIYYLYVYTYRNTDSNDSNKEKVHHRTIATQTCITMQDLRWLADEDLTDKNILRRTLTVKEVTASDSSAKFYTGKKLFVGENNFSICIIVIIY